MSKIADAVREIAPEESQPRAYGGGRPRTGLSALSPSDQARVILKYVPENQPSPRAWLELIKLQVMGPDYRGEPRPVEDLLFFLHACYRTNLDPLARQIYAVYRWDARLGREKMSVQVSIDGMRLVAQRSGSYGGQRDAVFMPEDESADHPTKATVTVYRLNPKSGRRMPVTASARWNEYVPIGKDGNPAGMWGKMPYLMLGKVAEALALRKAFPQELSGLYSAEEMEQSAPGNPSDLPRPARNVRARSYQRRPGPEAAQLGRSPDGGEAPSEEVQQDAEQATGSEQASDLETQKPLR
jgi:phage recombination protein Bet